MYEELIDELRNLLRAYKATDNGNCHQAKVLEAAADAMAEMNKCLDGVEADNDSLCKQIEELNEKLWAAEIDAEEAKEVIEELSKPRWISVTERLPEIDEYVLVYLFNRSPYIAWIDHTGQWQAEEFWLDAEDAPKAWMPLPEPPKEET